MSYKKSNPNGQATSANSEPVVIASDQSSISVTVATLPLPSGSATSAKQDLLLAELQLKADLTETQPVSLASLPSHPVTNAGTFPVQATLLAETTKVIGTVNVAGVVPVTGTFFQATQPVSGTVSTGGLTDTQIRATALPVSGIVTANIGTVNGIALDTSVNSLLKPASTLAAVTSITNTVTIKADTPVNQTNALKVDATATTQPISASTLPLPSGASTSVLQTTGNTSLGNIDTKLPTGLTVTANRLQVELPAGGTGLTNTELRATPVSISGSTTTVDTTTSGNITAISQSVALALNGKSGVAVQITGTWIGTLQFEGTIDGTNWVAINGVVAGTSTPGQTTTTNGIVRLTPSGLAQVRVTSTAFTSGTAVISIRASDATGGIFLNQSLTAGGNRIGQVQLTGSTTSTALGLGSSVTAYGNLRITAEPTSIFNDPFDGATIDTTNRWNAPVVSGMTITQSSGDLVTTTTTVNSNSAFIDTIPTFAPLGIGFLAFASAPKLEAQTGNLFALNQHRFWGFGNRPGTFNTTTPLLDAIGFEIGIDGQLYCVVYEAGVNRFRSSVSLTGVNLNTLISPSTGYVRFGIALRADTIVFYINSSEFPAQSFTVSSLGFTMPDIQALPIRIAAVNAATGTVGASTFLMSTLALGDTSGTGNSIIDGVHGFRKQTVKGPSSAAIATDSPAVIALHPTSPLPAGTNNIGNLNELRSATLAATVTAASGAAATLTLPAVVGQFHYITALDIVLYSAAARTGSATPTLVTTTNLPGSIAFTFSTAGAIGTNDVQALIRVTPLKSLLANTATTIVAPIAAGGIWRITATYFTGI